ncbi:AmmeMemoRadiSam system protein B [Anaerolineae bacterium CFX7]|nr:AmmeMemoRadiSam system protein B [Anaerolineae bacterium CFX7]
MSIIRQPVCADNRWYPRDAAHLRFVLDELFANVPAQTDAGELLALIAPHAGIQFSGQTAAYAYQRLAGAAFERVILLGPSHYQAFDAPAVNRADFFETPLGVVPVDTELVRDLRAQIEIQLVSAEREHSLEMQLPFLQRQLQKFSILPVMLSHPFYLYGLGAQNECETLAHALAPRLNQNTLLVASSDLSHLHSYDAVTYFDQGLENLIVEYNLGALVDFMVNEGEPRACGDTAIVTALLTARLRGANTVRVFYRSNSGDVTGNREAGQYTVGYMAAGIYKI